MFTSFAEAGRERPKGSCYAEENENTKKSCFTSSHVDRSRSLFRILEVCGHFLGPLIGGKMLF